MQSINTLNKVIPATINFIEFIPFSQENKEKIISDVLQNCNILGLRKDNSYESGFNLPLTEEWKLANLNNKKYLDYHDSRQIRFRTDLNGNYYKLGFKDCINYWSNDELNELKKCIDSAIKKHILH